jgi:hypothetical protein
MISLLGLAFALRRTRLASEDAPVGATAVAVDYMGLMGWSLLLLASLASIFLLEISG